MSTTDITVSTPTYWLTTNMTTIFQSGHISAGQVTTGLPTLETYATLDALNARLAALGQPPYVDGPTMPVMRK